MFFANQNLNKLSCTNGLAEKTILGIFGSSSSLNLNFNSSKLSKKYVGKKS